MLIFKIQPLKLLERLELRKYGNDRFGANRIVVVSDQKDPKKAAAETIAAKDILKKYKAAFDADKKLWWWNDKFRSETDLVALAAKACDEANAYLEQKKISTPETGEDGQAVKNPKLAELLKQLADIKDFVESTEPADQEQAQGKEIVTNAIDRFVEELANEVDEVRLNARLKEYFDFMAKFYTYSFNNKLLIWLQRPHAHYVLTAMRWKKQFKAVPKEGAVPIWIWAPATRQPSQTEKKNREEEWYELNRIDPGTRLSKDMWMELQEFINARIVITGRFIATKAYDIADVVGADGKEIESPTTASDGYDMRTHTNDEDNDHLDIMFDAFLKVAQDLNLTVKFIPKENLGGARGYSSGGTIALLDSATGPSKVKTAIHELAHEMMHQSYLKAQADGDDLKDPKLKRSILHAYVGHNIPQVLELQAEAVGYVVLRAFDIHWKHSVNYIALWRGTSEAIRANLNVITTTSNHIIDMLNEKISGSAPTQGGEPSAEPGTGEEIMAETEQVGTPGVHGHDVSEDEVAKMLHLDLSKLNGSINEAAEFILDQRNILKDLL